MSKVAPIRWLYLLPLHLLLLAACTAATSRLCHPFVSSACMDLLARVTERSTSPMLPMDTPATRASSSALAPRSSMEPLPVDQAPSPVGQGPPSARSSQPMFRPPWLPPSSPALLAASASKQREGVHVGAPQPCSCQTLLGWMERKLAYHRKQGERHLRRGRRTRLGRDESRGELKTEFEVVRGQLCPSFFQGRARPPFR